ncbi:MAG: DUF4342 domain-containing protein, partial [Clostridia bacterium]|nr:DUF4342 domain-containing protein [Clostridia bacterium]
MTRLEMVEKIREKTGVTYEQARETLEKSNWDMLDAIVSIERDNFKANEEVEKKAAAKETEARKEEAQSVPENTPAPKKRVVRNSSTGEIGDKIAFIVRWLGGLIKKGEDNHIDVIRKDDHLMSISITSLILLFLIAWWLPTILIIVGLFTGYRFRFAGTSIA